MFGGVIQKESFYIPNVVLLHSKCSPFTFQKESFCLAKRSPFASHSEIMSFGMVFMVACRAFSENICYLCA